MRAVQLTRPLLVLAAVVALGATAGSALAAGSTPAQWSTPANVSDLPASANRIADLQVVLDDAGTATYAWRESNGTVSRVRARSCTPTSCTAVEDLTDGTANVTGLRLALASSGTVAAIWTAGTDALQWRLRTNGTWGTAISAGTVAPSTTLVGATALGPGLAIAHTAPDAGKSVLSVTTCGRTADTCTTQRQSSAGVATGAVALDGDGRTNAGLAWVEDVAGGNHVVRWAPITATADAITVGTAVALSGETAPAKSSLAIDVDALSMTTVAWKEADASNPLVVQRFVLTAPPTGPAQPATATANPIVDDTIAIASDRKGSAVVTWAVSQGGAQVLSALPYAALAKGTQQAVTGEGVAQLPALGVTGDGQSLLAYVRDSQLATSNATTPAGTWSAVAIAPLAGAVVTTRPVVATSATGAVAAWVATSMTTGEQTLRTARFTAARTVLAPTVQVQRRTGIRWALATRVTTNQDGTFEQIGRITVRGRRIVACRITPRSITGNVSTAAICRLTRQAIRARRRGAIRIQLTTTFVAATGERATTRATYVLGRRR